MRILALAASVAACAIAATVPSPASAEVYIVMLKPGVDAASVANEHAARFNGRITHVYSTLGGYSIDLPDATASEAAAQIAQDPRVQMVGPDRTSRLDPRPTRNCVAHAATSSVLHMPCAE
jgi:hypothetical protein